MSSSANTTPQPQPPPRPPRLPDAAARRILLADADAFFVAVARFADPEGAGRAALLIVGGAPGSRGVVCSASYEARQFGVRSAMPIAQALRLCPRATCVPVPRGACARQSRAIAAVLARYAPVVEGASIDEWYLDLTGTDALYGGISLAEVALRIRAAVQATTGMSVSFGGGSNKLIAKLAVEHAKPKPGTAANGVFVVAAGGEADFMAGVTLADIPMIGPGFRARLEELGLRTVPDVLATGSATLEHALGKRAARWLEARARGEHEGDVAPRERQVSISHEDTFDHDLTSDDDISQELVRLVTHTVSDLRAKGLGARTVNIKLRDTDFRTRRASRTLGAPVVSDRIVLAAAHELLGRLRAARRVPVRLLGVSLSGLTDADVETQLSLFEDEPTGSMTETARDRALANAVDTLRAKYGAQAIVPGRLAERPAAGDYEARRRRPAPPA